MLVTAVTLLKHSRVEHDILELSGGSGNLGNLVGRYEKAVHRYAHRPLKHPVIVLIDNDSGSEPVFGAMKQHHITANQTTNLDFYHVCFNLYVVKTPECGLKGISSIEDLFDGTTLAEKLEGRSFSRSDKFDNGKFYGKIEFADRIVRAKFSTIDFSRFVPLLDRLISVLDDYAKRLP